MKVLLISLLLSGFGLAQTPQPQIQPPPRKDPPAVNLLVDIGLCQARLSQSQQQLDERERELLTWAVAEIQKRDAEIEKLKKDQETKPEAK